MSRLILFALLFFSASASFAMKSTKASLKERKSNNILSYRCEKKRAEKLRRTKEAQLEEANASFAMKSTKASLKERDSNNIWSYRCAKKRTEKLRRFEEYQLAKAKKAEVSAQMANKLEPRKDGIDQQKQSLNDGSD